MASRTIFKKIFDSKEKEGTVSNIEFISTYATI